MKTAMIPIVESATLRLIPSVSCHMWNIYGYMRMATRLVMPSYQP
jgi:hypothetical protein